MQILYIIPKDILTECFASDTELYILGDFNINHCAREKYFFVKKQSTPHDYQFCSLYGLKQLIEFPTRRRPRRSSPTEYIFATLF